MTSASLIVINWNGAAFLPLCLEALLGEATPDDEIIIVDNASTDDSVEQVRARFSGVTLICNERNLGYAGGANVGLRAAQDEGLILLNPDVQVHAGWLAALKAALQDETVGVAGCKLYYPGGEVIQHAGGIIRFPQASADHYGYRQKDEGQWDHGRDVDYVTGAALALRRDVFEAVGGFDEDFFPAYYEEVDYCFRVRDAGYRVVYAPGAVATHFEHAVLEDASDNFVRFFNRNRLWFVLKQRGPQYFLAHFVPAEMDWLRQNAAPQVQRVFGSAYLDVILDYPPLHLQRWDVPDEIFQGVLEALVNLRHQAISPFVKR